MSNQAARYSDKFKHSLDNFKEIGPSASIAVTVKLEDFFSLGLFSKGIVQGHIGLTYLTLCVNRFLSL